MGYKLGRVVPKWRETTTSYPLFLSNQNKKQIKEKKKLKGRIGFLQPFDTLFLLIFHCRCFSPSQNYHQHIFANHPSSFCNNVACRHHHLLQQTHYLFLSSDRLLHHQRPTKHPHRTEAVPPPKHLSNRPPFPFKLTVNHPSTSLLPFFRRSLSIQQP